MIDEYYQNVVTMRQRLWNPLSSVFRSCKAQEDKYEEDKYEELALWYGYSGTLFPMSVGARPNKRRAQQRGSDDIISIALEGIIISSSSGAEWENFREKKVKILDGPCCQSDKN